MGTGWLMLPGTIIICSQFKMKFLMWPSQIVACVNVTLCGLACQLPACPSSASAPVLPAFLCYTCRHSHHRCPLCVQAGSGTRHQLQSSSSPGCAPCLLSPAVTTTDPGAYIRKQNCLYSDPEGQTGSFIVIQSKPR